MKSKTLRCAIYIRVSTTEQMMHGKSLEAQKDYLIHYAQEHDTSSTSRWYSARGEDRKKRTEAQESHTGTGQSCGT